MVHQDVAEEVSTEDELIQFLIGTFDESQWLDLKQFIERLLDASLYSDDQLMQIWNTSPADVWFRRGEDLRDFLSKVAATLAKDR